jgi:hypothetical protein
LGRIAQQENSASDQKTLLANKWMPAQRVLPFGKHKEKTLGLIGETLDGISYLFWVAHNARDIDQSIRRDVLAYLDFPIIAERLRSHSPAQSPDVISSGWDGQTTQKPIPEPSVQTCDPPFDPT